MKYVIPKNSPMLAARMTVSQIKEILKANLIVADKATWDHYRVQRWHEVEHCRLSRERHEAQQALRKFERIMEHAQRFEQGVFA